MFHLKIRKRVSFTEVKKNRFVCRRDVLSTYNPVEIDRDKMGHYIFTLQIYYVYASLENSSKLYNNLVADKKVIIEQNVHTKYNRSLKSYCCQTT